MNRHDVGVLKKGDTVFVGGLPATVVSTHEPEWIDHRTKAFRKEFQGADLKLSSGVYAYTHAAQIETTAIREAVRGGRMRDKP